MLSQVCPQDCWLRHDICIVLGAEAAAHLRFRVYSSGVAVVTARLISKSTSLVAKQALNEPTCPSTMPLIPCGPLLLLRRLTTMGAAALSSLSFSRSSRRRRRPRPSRMTRATSSTRSWRWVETLTRLVTLRPRSCGAPSRRLSSRWTSIDSLTRLTRTVRALTVVRGMHCARIVLCGNAQRCALGKFRCVASCPAEPVLSRGRLGGDRL